MFPDEMEADIALFMKHCSLLRIPRTRDMLRQDIVHYVLYNELSFPKMCEDGPGDCCKYPNVHTL